MSSITFTIDLYQYSKLPLPLPFYIVQEQELVKVIAIKYEIRPPRLVCLKLAFIEADTGRISGGHFTIK